MVLHYFTSAETITATANPAAEELLHLEKEVTGDLKCNCSVQKKRKKEKPGSEIGGKKTKSLRNGGT